MGLAKVVGRKIGWEGSVGGEQGSVGKDEVGGVADGGVEGWGLLTGADGAGGFGFRLELHRGLVEAVAH
jgi:hypothetical protein